MNREEIKGWAKQKLSSNFWSICGTILVADIITNFTIVTTSTANIDSSQVAYNSGYSIGWIFYFVNVGLAYYLVKLINNENTEFKDIFKFSGDFLRCLGAILLQTLWVLLYMLAFIIPGIIKSLGYSLVPYLLADDYYKDMSVPDILKKSEEMMKGHKMDLFLLSLSFIPWIFVVIITCGLGALYVTPYMHLTIAKFLNNIKEEADEKEFKPSSKKKSTEPKGEFCPNCGKKVNKDAEYCGNCGTKI